MFIQTDNTSDMILVLSHLLEIAVVKLRLTCPEPADEGKERSSQSTANLQLQRDYNVAT
jgi:hypothetical protein